MRQKNKNAFTLVELIVVITIIAILGTVGFISYSNYLTTARDSNRISQLTRIADALQTYSTRNILPLPESYVTITDGNRDIAYQGDLGESILQTISYSTNARDPRDNTPFTYFLSASRNNFQLLALMEDAGSLQSMKRGTQEVYADFSNRYPKTYGTRLGVLTDGDNTPIQRLDIEDNMLDITSTTLTLKSFLSDTEYVVDNLTTLPQLQQLIPQRGRLWSVVDNAFVGPPTRYPGCDTDDIIIGNYRVAACNVGATVAATTNTSYGRLFQWGEDVAWDTTSGVTDSNNCTWNRGTQSCTSPSLSDWSSTVSDTASGGADRWDAWGDTRGPCAPGYRVPSVTDWQNLVSAGGWGSDGAAMQTALQLPYAGSRGWSSGAWNGGGFFGSYWSSSPSGTDGHRLYFNSSNVNPASSVTRAGGFSVRCFKN